jgi:hypothetical protein
MQSDTVEVRDAHLNGVALHAHSQPHFSIDTAPFHAGGVCLSTKESYTHSDMTKKRQNFIEEDRYGWITSPWENRWN